MKRSKLNKPLIHRRKRKLVLKKSYDLLVKQVNERIDCEKLPKNKKGKPYKSKTRALYYLTISGREKEIKREVAKRLTIGMGYGA
jgi:hypothetical protein